MAETIPGPRGIPFLGNVLDMDMEVPIRGLERLADQYGPIYQITLKGARTIVCSSAELMEQLTDEKRFVKLPPRSLREAPGAKGLFSASNEDPDWAQGHRILMPSFAPLAVQDMFDDMKDIANQLVLSWARKGPENVIVATDDFTRLTLDTIALCTMDYRFNSFYQEKMHPFVDAMFGVLSERGNRAARPSFVTKMMIGTDRKFAANQAVLRQTGLDIIQNRRQNPVEKHDVLNNMIYGKDPKTGQVMRDELISAQMTTFLIAGHETTSGLLSFAFAHLLKSPNAYFKAQAEVDQVVGKRAIEFTDLKNLSYLSAVLRETARPTPTVPVLQKEINHDLSHEVVSLNGYVVTPSDTLMVLLSKAQKDPSVWGDDADEFKPERMLDEPFDKIMAQYPGSWKPFGNGKRACIGRPFAWQEALLVMAMVLQNFDVKLEDPSYQIALKMALTVKPDNLKIRVQPRYKLTATSMNKLVHSGSAANGISSRSNGPTAAESTNGSQKALRILYGSNTGTCQAFAQKTAAAAASKGFAAQVVDMDSAVDLVDKTTPVVIFTSSYEGEPPDNAVKFVEWLQMRKARSLDGLEYAVFGCGHRDWTRTFHRIPKLVDELLSSAGGKRIATLGLTDAAKGNMYGDFEDWLDGSLWPSLSAEALELDAAEGAVDFELTTDARATALRFDVHPATVRRNEKLTSGNEPEKYHMELTLPSDSAYECGDYLAVLPQNTEDLVKTVLARFNLPWDAVINIKGEGPSALPLNTPTPVSEILRSYVELSQPVTKKTLRVAADHTNDAVDRARISELANDEARFEKEVMAKRLSLFSLLRRYPSVELPFGLFLSLLPPLQIRQYSISSSPLADPTKCSLTYGILDTASLADPKARFQGVTSSFLKSLKPDDQVQVSIRPAAKKTFRLPLDDEKTPLVMFAAGTGLAPFHGFLQQREIQIAAGRSLAKAVLYLGCRSQTTDRLYAQQMDQWVRQGVVDVRYAFSQEPDASDDCKYVPDRMLKQSDEIVNLWRAGARVYLCGSRKFSQGVRRAAEQLALAAVGENGKPTEEMKSRFEQAMQERVASDVFD